MRIGIPQALLFHRYEPFIRAFFDNLSVDTVYSGQTNRDILEKGIRGCVDEACLPMKIFVGHVSKLMDEADKVVVPRLMKCEFGDSICPKFAGLPELVASSETQNRLVFTEPLLLNNKNKLKKALAKQGRQIEVTKYDIMEAFAQAENKMKTPAFAAGHPAERVIQSSGGYDSGDVNRCNIALLGHPYNIYDSYANMRLLDKLKRLGAGVVTGEEISLKDINVQMTGLIKAPYWLFYRENFGKACELVKRKSIDGILYVSSFCCGTDSVTIEMIKSRIDDFPMLVIKLDEHTAEAGVDTRLEAFVELLERRRRKGMDV